MIGVVQKTLELARILALPRRDPLQPSELAAIMTQALKTPEGKMELRPYQAAALRDLHDYKGLFSPASVGTGKTLVSFLSPVVVNAERPLLLIPANLRQKTDLDFKQLSKHFRSHSKIHVQSYQYLGRTSGALFLEETNPDLLILDECHRARNLKAAVTRRIARYLSKHPDCIVCAMSGSITKRSILDFHHILQWTHSLDTCPLPRGWHESQDWARALDEKIPEENRVALGALKVFGPTLKEARKGYGKRLHDTPGVVGTKENKIKASLSVLHHKLVLSELKPHFTRLRKYWENPSGIEVWQASDYWSIARQLASGFYYEWDPQPPLEWREARKEWSQFVRHTLSHNRRGLDSEKQVADAYPEHYLAWSQIKNTFKPNVVTRWLSDETVRFAIRWAEDNSGIVFTEHVAFGHEFANVSGMPFFHQGGLDMQSGGSIEAYRGCCCASIAANGEGRNLQRYNSALVINCSPNGSVWEQLLGRLHRPGQEADEVVFTWMLSCKEQLDGMLQAFEDAKYIESITNQPQKLVYADKDFPEFAGGLL